MNVFVFTGGNGNANLFKHLKGLVYLNLSFLMKTQNNFMTNGVLIKLKNTPMKMQKGLI